ncbi:hypothetical protein GQ42DRAFT_8244 [Ramicandelaber brevisporus]|nr:hypothetical protein GQ42DRAFT_8244 [Ramicandelaber brevisporus]
MYNVLASVCYFLAFALCDGYTHMVFVTFTVNLETQSVTTNKEACSLFLQTITSF